MAEASADPYAQFHARSAARSARMLERVRDVLTGVSQGQLTPAALDRAYDTFVTERGAAYADRLAAVNARFFAGLALEAAGQAPSVSLSPPRFTASDPASWFVQLAEYAANRSRQAVAALQADVDRASTADAPAAAGVTARRARRASASGQAAAAERMSRVAGLYLDLLDGMSEVADACEAEYLQRVCAEAYGSPDGHSVRLDGRLGDAATTSLWIENTTPGRTTVHCAVSEIRRADGVGPAFSPHVIVSPPHAVLDPGEDARVGLTVALDPAAFEAGPTYVGRVLVHREGHSTLDLPMRITAAATGPAGAR